MRHTVKEISEDLFNWLAQLLLGNSRYHPPQLDQWNEKDWDVARTIVFMHGMGPLWGKLCMDGWECKYMPVEFQLFLVGQYQNNALRVEKIRFAYHKVAEKLKQDNIEFLPFKGIQLTPVLYSEAALRPMADIDLYIGREDKNKVTDILTSMGYAISAMNAAGITFYPEESINGISSEFLVKETYEGNIGGLYNGENPNSPYSIDVHIEMNIKGFIGLTEVFEQARKSREKVLHNEEYFIYLLLHAAKHLLSRDGRWLHLYDIYLFQQHYRVDAAYIMQRAEELKVQHLLYIALIMSGSMFSSDFSGLRSALYNKLLWRHKKLVSKLQLSEMSCCNPWNASPFAFIIWSHGYKDLKKSIQDIKNKRVNTKTRQSSALIPAPRLGYRLVKSILSQLHKKPRASWNILASHGLDPTIDWR